MQPDDVSVGAVKGRVLVEDRLHPVLARLPAGAAFESLALSFGNLAARPRTAAELHWWLDRSAGALHASGKRFLPFVLRRKVVQRAIVEAACDYASAELRSAARDPEHPLRRAVLSALRRFAERLAAGDADAQAQAERLRRALLESIQAGPVVRTMLGRVREQLEQDLGDRRSALSTLIDRQLRTGILDLLADAGRRSAFDRWVRTTCGYCSVGCGMLLGVRDDKAVAVAGDPDHPVNEGRLCPKGLSEHQSIAAEGRLTTPLSYLLSIGAVGLEECHYPRAPARAPPEGPG